MLLSKYIKLLYSRRIDFPFNKCRWGVKLIVLFCLLMSGQKAYCQQGTFIANGPNGLYSVDISTCTKTLLTTFCNYPSGSIALDGTTLYINDGANLYSTTLGPTGTTNNCDLLGAFLSGNKSIYGLTVGPDGIVYAASGSLIETYNPVTKNFGTLGRLPSNLTIGGDLLFYQGDLYEMCSNNNLVLVNRTNPAESKVYMQFTAGTIFGLASVTKKCSPNQMYAISRSGDIYAVDMANKVQTITPTCRLGISINDAASIAETQSTPPPNPPISPSPIVYCVNTTAVPLTATTSGSNDTLKWYADASGREEIADPTPLVGSQQTTTTYYVSQTDITTGCESDPTPVVVNVDTLSSPSISVVASATTVCTGAPVKFTAATDRGGTPPRYQWQLNGIDVGIDTSFYMNDTLKDGSLIQCKLVSNAKCLRTPNAISNTVAITVNKIDSLPTIKITASDTSFSPCSTISFKASITEGGTKPKFIWKQNGVVVGTNDPVFTSGNFVDKDTITCSLISNWAVCLLADTIVSNRIKMYATGYVTPTDSIYTDTTIVCSGTLVTFTSKATKGGTAPTYQWKINGRNVVNGPDSVFKTTSLKDGDVVSCVLNSNIPCPLNNLAESNTIKMHVKYTPDSVITIQTSDTNICPGAKASFMATSPRNLQLDWAINGVYIETNSTNSFSTSVLQDGDRVSCRFVTDYGCGVVTIRSNPIVVRVVKDVPPTIVVTTDTTTICAGSTLRFLAATTNGGVKPHYQWMVNGNKVGGDSAKFSTSILSDSDAVSCSIISDIVCLTKKDGVSKPLIITVVSPPAVPPIVGSDNVCQGKNSTLTDKTVGGKWTSSAKDIITIDADLGIVTGYKSGSSTISYAVKNSCGTTTQALVITVVDSPNVFTITGPDSVCVNNTIPLTEQAKGGEWSSDNAAVATVDKASGVVSGMNAGTVSIKYTISNSCGTDYKAKVIYVVGEKATGSYTINQEPTCIAPASGSVTVNISGIDKSYQYEINGKRYNNGSAATGLFAGNYDVLLYNSLGCVVKSLPLELKLKIDATCDTFYVPTVFIPFGSYSSGKQLRPYGGSSSIQRLSFRVLNRFGNLVYESHDLNKGWDGTVNGVMQEAGAYVWYLSYTLFNAPPKEMKGTSVLIR